MLFVLHIVVFITTLISFAVPFVLACVRREVLAAVGWGAMWWSLSVGVGCMLGAWDGPPWPRVSLLWRASR